MGGPKDGKYIIKPAAGRQSIVGVDLVGPIVPVITDGDDNVVSPSVFVQRQLCS
jgi:hypothetical protein